MHAYYRKGYGARILEIIGALFHPDTRTCARRCARRFDSRGLGARVRLSHVATSHPALLFGCQVSIPSVHSARHAPQRVFPHGPTGSPCLTPIAAASRNAIGVRLHRVTVELKLTLNAFVTSLARGGVGRTECQSAKG